MQRIPSPDGALVLSIYDRQCPHNVLTTASIEQPARFLEKSGEVVCYLMSWTGKHPIEAEWKNRQNISISTTDRLERIDYAYPNESCNGIKISYHVQFRNETQTTDDPEVVAKIRKVLAEIEPCISPYYEQANSKNDPAREVKKWIDRGQHRSAVELIMGYAYSASCPISPATYQTLKELSETFDLKPGYLERVEPLVKSRSSGLQCPNLSFLCVNSANAEEAQRFSN
ncbi:MAG TPA: hypothetical protein VJT71_11340 [Pyrinomonadaceae bacterium]|nr:hypothetical protein [Pyrinomonadaceae bacterium]